MKINQLVKVCTAVAAACVAMAGHAQVLDPNRSSLGSPGNSISDADSGDIAVSTDGRVYVSYMERTGVNGRVELSVYRLANAQWQSMVRDDAPIPGYIKTQIALSESGIPYLAHVGTYAGQTELRRFDGEQWQLLGTASEISGLTNTQYPSIAASPSGEVCVSFSHGDTNWRATVMCSESSGTYALGTAGFTEYGIMQNSLAFAPNGTAYVAYRTIYQTRQVGVMRFNGISWEPVGTRYFSPGAVQNVHLTIAADGTPYVAFPDDTISKIRVMYFDGSDWETSALFNVGAYGTDYVTMKTAPDGSVYLVRKSADYLYTDANDNKVYCPGLAAIERLSNGVWSTVTHCTADSVEDSPESFALGFDGDSRPYLYYASRGDQLKPKVIRYDVTN